jgi:N-acetylmuramic acid 6-phosphate etherase
VVSDARPSLDQLPAEQVVELLLDAESRVVPTLRAAVAELAKAAEVLAGVVQRDGRLVFAGAGTSGRLAAAEAAELPGTFGIEPGRCIPIIAGAASPAIDDAAEDDANAGTERIRALRLDAGDVVIAVAASGSTPFTVAAATEARRARVPVIAIVNATDTLLSTLASVAVELPVGAEVLRGSTRLTAGTAQKVALNTLTTTAMARAGRVHGDLMIDVVAANAKLRERAAGIVAEIAGCEPTRAAVAIEACEGNARAAVLHLVRGMAPPDALALAARHPTLRAALETR